MARNEQLIRQHKLLQLLEMSRYGRTLEELRDDVVADLGLSQLSDRTIRRDIEALQSAGFDIFTEDMDTRGRVWKLGRRDRGMHNITATASELISLSIGRDLLYPLAGTQYWQGIESFWVKIQEEMPTGVWEMYERYRKALHVYGTPAKSYLPHEGMLRTINRAVLEHRVLEVEYKPPDKPATVRKIEPYGLAVYQSSIYVIAAATEVIDPEQKMRHWKLDRFVKATALDQWFKPDPEVDVEKHLKKSVGIFSGDSPLPVTIQLTTLAAGWVREDPWHPEQTLMDRGNGRWELVVPSTHPREIIPKVLMLGAEAQLIGPDEFRSEMCEVVKRLGEKYQ